MTGTMMPAIGVVALDMRHRDNLQKRKTYIRTLHETQHDENMILDLEDLKVRVNFGIDPWLATGGLSLSRPFESIE